MLSQQRASLLSPQKPSGRIAALDLGEAYTGVAISDSGRVLARPLEVVPADRLVEYLRALFEEENVAEVVAGVPRTLKGEVGFQAKRALTKLDALKKTFPRVDFVEWDERLTTRQAISSRRKSWTGRRKRRIRERVDHLAAAGMLQEYLDRKETVEAVRRRFPQA